MTTFSRAFSRTILVGATAAALVAGGDLDPGRAQTPSSDPATWEEWLLPLGDHEPGDPFADCRLFVREVGEGSEPVVALHGGWGGEHLPLLRGLLPLADDHRLVFYDQRGSLRSPCDTPPAAADHVADLETLRRELGVARLTLLGHSNGGWLAQAYAVEHPERVRALVLLSPVPAADSLPSRRDEERWRRPEVRAELERHGLALNRRPEDSMREWGINHRIIFAAVNLHDVTRWREVPVPWFYDQEAASSAAASMPEAYDFTPALARLSAPIRVIVGDDDFIPLASQRAWVERVPNADLVVIPDAGHISWVDRPTAVLDAIRDVLDHGR